MAVYRYAAGCWLSPLQPLVAGCEPRCARQDSSRLTFFVPIQYTTQTLNNGKDDALLLVSLLIPLAIGNNARTMTAASERWCDNGRECVLPFVNWAVVIQPVYSTLFDFARLLRGGIMFSGGGWPPLVGL
jgi:hypothetical protein